MVTTILLYKLSLRRIDLNTDNKDTSGCHQRSDFFVSCRASLLFRHGIYNNSKLWTVQIFIKAMPVNIFNLLNLFIFPFFGLFRDLRGIITVQTQGSESGSGKSDSQKYSCPQGRFSTVTVRPGLSRTKRSLTFAAK
jgi:hypothetical protein